MKKSLVIYRGLFAARAYNGEAAPEKSRAHPSSGTGTAVAGSRGAKPEETGTVAADLVEIEGV